MADELLDKIAELQSYCDSPIEEDFALGLAVRWLERTRGSLHMWRPPSFATHLDFSAASPEPVVLGVFPQAQIGDYRLDFVLTFRTRPTDARPEMLAVECDGHAFHERTREQARRDRRRDRDIQRLGMAIYRFTGAEIWADHHACADEAIDRILNPRLAA